MSEPASETTAISETSEPVPAVVGMQTKSEACGRNSRSNPAASATSPGLDNMIRATLAVSIVEPPPMASTQSGPNSARNRRHSSTESVSGS